MPISVILPNYNHARWLPQALGALVRQTVASDEIIVVDDASTDGSVAIIEDFQRSYEHVRLIRHERNRGVEAAVQSALAQARGEFLFFAAADDFVLPGLFARASAALRANPEAAFFCSEVLLISESDQISGFRPVTIPRATPGYVPPGEMRHAIRSSDNWFIGTSVVYRHAHLAAIGYFDRSLGTLQDAMATRLLAFRHGFYFEPDVLAVWRVSKDSLSMQAALQPSESNKLLDLARRWIAVHFPADVREEYGRLFDRRLRFAMARQRLTWQQGRLDTQGIADILDCGAFERGFLRFLSVLPLVSQIAVLIWLTLRMRPYALRQMLASYWRSVTLNQSRSASLRQFLPAPSAMASTVARPVQGLDARSNR